MDEKSRYYNLTSQPGKLTFIFLALSLGTLCFPGAVDAADSYIKCIMEALAKAENSLSVGALKDSCRHADPSRQRQDNHLVGPSGGELDEEASEKSALGRRLQKERRIAQNIFAITPHRQNYILAVSYNTAPNSLGLSLDESEVDRFEMKFQMSFKTLLAKNFIGADNGFLYGAYTLKSFWQAYNDNISSPFRETNHEPEIFVAYRNSWQIWGWNNAYILAGFNHQSNGRSNPLSRSWNRIYLDFIFEKENLALSIKPWYRIPEEDKERPLDAGGDDNPDISRYLGYGEITAAWSVGSHTLSCMVRNNLRTSANRGAVEFGWSFPLWLETPLKGYVQYFNGYGESLIDYDTSVNRLGVGVLLADWL